MNFSAKDKRILKKLADKLPSPPMPGWDRDAICAALDEDWEGTLRVIFKTRKAAEMRQPDMPVVRGISIGGEFGYRLVGSTGHDGKFILYPVSVPEGHARAG